MNDPVVSDVIQASAWYPPYQIGGTEVYVEGLVGELAALGIGSTVMVPRGDGMPERYEHVGTPVETYSVNEEPEANELRDGAPHRDFATFRQHLATHRSSIYHQHSWTRGCGPHHLRAAREAGLRTVLTVHVPSNFCLRGTMVKFGEAACDGKVEETTCGACWAQSRGLPKAIAQPLANLPLRLATRARRRESRIATALSARALGADKLSQLHEMIDNCDRLVAVCGWVYDALLANGAPPDKLALSRQGVSDAYVETLQDVRRISSTGRAKLSLLYLGSWNEVKGIDVVVRAVRSLPPDIALELTISSAAKWRRATGL